MTKYGGFFEIFQYDVLPVFHSGREIANSSNFAEVLLFVYQNMLRR